MLDAVEAVGFEHGLQGAAGFGGRGARQQVVEEAVDHAAELAAVAAGGGESLQLGAARGGEVARLLAQQGGHGEGVVGRGHEGIGAGQQAGLGAALVDGEVVDDRFHGEGHGALQGLLGLAHDGLQALLRLGLAFGAEEKAHAAAGHAAEHPEAPEIVAERGAGALDQGVGVEVAGPGNDGLDGSVEVLLGAGADLADVAAFEVAHHFVQDADGLLPSGPLGFGAQQVLLGDHFEDGADVLRHAAVDQHQALLQAVARGLRDFVEREDVVVGEEAAAADAVFGIAGLRRPRRG